MKCEKTIRKGGFFGVMVVKYKDGLPTPKSEKIAKKIQRTFSNKQEKEN